MFFISNIFIFLFCCIFNCTLFKKKKIDKDTATKNRNTITKVYLILILSFFEFIREIILLLQYPTEIIIIANAITYNNVYFQYCSWIKNIPNNITTFLAELCLYFIIFLYLIITYQYSKIIQDLRIFNKFSKLICGVFLFFLIILMFFISLFIVLLFLVAVIYIIIVIVIYSSSSNSNIASLISSIKTYLYISFFVIYFLFIFCFTIFNLIVSFILCSRIIKQTLMVSDSFSKKRNIKAMCNVFFIIIMSVTFCFLVFALIVSYIFQAFVYNLFWTVSEFILLSNILANKIVFFFSIIPIQEIRTSISKNINELKIKLDNKKKNEEENDNKDNKDNKEMKLEK